MANLKQEILNLKQRIVEKSPKLKFQEKSGKTLLQDWRLIYKIIAFLILFVFFMLGIVYGVFIEYWYINPKEVSRFLISLPRLYNLNVLVSFWSVQTNFLALLYFFLAILYHGKEQKNKLTSFTAQISIAIYITVTFLLFWTLVFYAVVQAQGSYRFASTMDKVVTIATHSVTPLLPLIYVILCLGKIKITYKDFFLKKVWWMLSYPIGYLIFINLRASLLYADGLRSYDPFLFPYDFVDFYTPYLPLPLIWNNILLVVMGVFFLAGINFIIVALNSVVFKITKGQGFWNNNFHKNKSN